MFCFVKLFCFSFISDVTTVLRVPLANMLMNLISPESRVSNLNFCCRLYLHSARGGELRKLAEVAKNSQKDELCEFKGIQGHRIRHRSNRLIRLPID